MKTLVDDRLRAEAARFGFRFACEDCAHFDDLASRCTLAYPLAPRRESLATTQVYLCKEFDLG